MSRAFVVAAAMVRMGKYPRASYEGIAAPAVHAVVRDSGLEIQQIDAAFCSHSYGGMLLGQRILRECGIGGLPVVNVDNACSGGGSALHLAVEAIESGRYESVLVVGAEKLTQFGGGTLPLNASDCEVRQGMVMPALYAMRARRYLHERGARKEDLAAVSVKARLHGSLNPNAQLRSRVTPEEVLQSRPIAEPLTLFQCCPVGDGAAALMVVSSTLRNRLALPAVAVRASVLHSGRALGGYRDMLWPQISAATASEAYEVAGVAASDLDVVEMHDAFTIAELIYYEALGLCDRGDGLRLIRTGATTLGGRQVVNPSGGLLSKGHPVGASGVAQIVEAFEQLLGRAGARQVPGAKLALTHVTGGGIAGMDHGACCIHVLERAA